MKFLFAIMAIFSGCANSSSGDITILTNGDPIVFHDCQLIWNAQHKDDGSQAQWTYIDTQCPGADLPEPMNFGGATTLYINARAYTCPLGQFVATTKPENQFVVHMECRDEDVADDGFEKPGEG